MGDRRTDGVGCVPLQGEINKAVFRNSWEGRIGHSRGHKWLVFLALWATGPSPWTQVVVGGYAGFHANSGQSLPSGSRIRDVSQSSIYQSLTWACSLVVLSETCGFEFYHHRPG